MQMWLRIFMFPLLLHLFSRFAKCHIPRLLIISLDGFRWDYLSKVKGKTPNFDKLIAEGAHSRFGMKNCYPTLTTANHFTLVTGLYVENHGLVGNYMYDPVFNETYSLWNESQQYDSKWFDNGAEPIWVTNQLQGSNRRSGSVYWPASYAPIKGVVPYFKAPGYNFNEDETPMPYKNRIHTIVDWFSAQYPINLGLLYVEEPDETGHKFGPDSQEVKDKIIELDEFLGHLFDELDKKGLLNELNIIVTSDHGMASTPLEKFVDLKNVVEPSAYKMLDWTVLPKEGETDDVYKKISEAGEKSGGFHTYRKSDVPPRYFFSKHRRIAPIVLDPKEHYTPVENLSYTEEKPPHKGTHGYDNHMQDMHPIFFARGPAFKKGAVVESFNNLDVYPLMCHILGLTPAPNNGSLDIVKELLLEEEYTTFTFATFIAVAVLAASVVGCFTINACRQHSKMKRKQRLVSSVPDGIKFSTLSQNEAKFPLLTSSDDDSIP